MSLIWLLSVNGAGEHLVEQGAADHVADGGLGNLADRGRYVLDLDGRLHRVDTAEVRDGGHADGDGVPGDDLLGRDRHGDRPQGDFSHAHLLVALAPL